MMGTCLSVHQWFSFLLHPKAFFLTKLIFEVVLLDPNQPSFKKDTAFPLMEGFLLTPDVSNQFFFRKQRSFRILKPTNPTFAVCVFSRLGADHNFVTS